MFHRLRERIYNTKFSKVNALREARSASYSQEQMCLKLRHAEGNVKALELKAHPLKPIALTALVNYRCRWPSISWEENKSLLSTESELEEAVSSEPVGGKPGSFVSSKHNFFFFASN